MSVTLEVIDKSPDETEYKVKSDDSNATEIAEYIREYVSSNVGNVEAGLLGSGGKNVRVKFRPGEIVYVKHIIEGRFEIDISTLSGGVLEDAARSAIEQRDAKTTPDMDNITAPSSPGPSDFNGEGGENGEEEFPEVVDLTQDELKEDSPEKGKIAVIREDGEVKVVPNAEAVLLDTDKRGNEIIETDLDSFSDAANVISQRRGTDSESDKRERARRESGARPSGSVDEPASREKTINERAEVSGDRTTFTPPVTKEEAGYKGPGEGENAHLDCKDCVHYMQGGGCHIVQGDIDPDGYCESHYGDVLLSADMYDGEFNINLAIWGKFFEDRFGRISINSIVASVKEAIRSKVK